MARRRKQDSGQGSLDSLLDTMTNVVGVLIVTQVNVSSAARRIRANLPDITVAMLEDLKKRDAEGRRRLEELNKPEGVTPEQLGGAKQELRRLLARRDQEREVAREVARLEEELDTLRKEFVAMRQQMEAEGGDLARIRRKQERNLEELSERKPKLVRLPNPRTPVKGAKEVRMIVRGGRLLPFDRAGILDRLAAKITPRKDLLSRDPKMKTRYHRDKLAQLLETLKESDRDYRLEFVVHHNGHVQAYCFPRDGRGETVEELAKAGARGRRVMAQAFGDRNYLRYFVTEDSFEQYIELRRMAEKIQIPVGWIFAEDSARQVLNLGERQIHATPHPDWKPPPPSPGAPPPKKQPTIDILD